MLLWIGVAERVEPQRLLQRGERFLGALQLAQRRAQVAVGRGEVGISRAASAKRAAARSVSSARSHSLPSSKCTASQSGASAERAFERRLRLVEPAAAPCTRSRAPGAGRGRLGQSSPRAGTPPARRRRSAGRTRRAAARTDRPSARRDGSIGRRPPRRRCAPRGRAARTPRAAASGDGARAVAEHDRRRDGVQPVEPALQLVGGLGQHQARAARLAGGEGAVQAESRMTTVPSAELAPGGSDVVRRNGQAARRVVDGRPPVRRSARPRRRPRGVDARRRRAVRSGDRASSRRQRPESSEAPRPRPERRSLATRLRRRGSGRTG